MATQTAEETGREGEWKARSQMQGEVGEEEDDAQLFPEFEVFLHKESFKFNAAHFVAFAGYRERLHGHNYSAAVRFLGGSQLRGDDGYVMDFREVKDALRRICREMDEHFIVPERSDVLEIQSNDEEVILRTEGGDMFRFPRGDCVMLPLVHSSSEELSRYLYRRLVEDMTLERLRERGVRLLEMRVQECAGQEAVFRCRIPKSLAQLHRVTDPHGCTPRPCLPNARAQAEAEAEAHGVG